MSQYAMKPILKPERFPPLTRTVVAVMLCLGVANVFADSLAVKESNYEIGFTSGDTNVSGDRDSHFFRLNGRGTFPLATYLGASLTGAYADTNAGDAFLSQTGTLTLKSQPPSCDLTNTELNADLFLRSASFGRVGLRYGAGRARSDCSATFVATGTDKLDTKTTAAYAEYYFSRVTVAAARTQTEFDGGTDFDSATLSVVWYPNDDLRLALAVDGIDLEDSYRFDLEYQPPIFGNASSLLLGYATQDQAVRTRSITVGFRYYFGKRIEVITRDRHYR